MYINGRWLIEPEVKAYIHKLEELNAEIRAEADRVLRENAELREKQESADRQIAEYDDELRKAKELLSKVPNVLSNLCFAVSEAGGCEFCPYGKTNPDGACDVERLRKAIEGGSENE